MRLNVPKNEGAIIAYFMDHAERYAKASCYHLCQNVRNRLPRELRDIVYDYLLCDEKRDVSAVGGGNDCEPIHAKIRFHFWGPEYVGLPMLTELLETWYKSTRLHLGLDIGFLDDFLMEKVDFIDVPRHQLLSKILITLDQRDLVSYRNKVVEDRFKAFSPYARLLERLEALFLLREGASIHIHPYRPITGFIRRPSLQDVDVPKRVLIDITTPIFDTLRRLKNAGYSITAVMSDDPIPQWSYQLWNLEIDNGIVSDGVYYHPEGETALVWRGGMAPPPPSRWPYESDEDYQ